MTRPEPNIKEPPDRSFTGLRQFNCPEGLSLAGRRDRMAPHWAHWFSGAGMVDRLALALSDRNAIDMKEFTESIEFFQRIRRAIRARTVMDLCCGHGLTGLLFAIFERSVDSVLLIDQRQPQSFEQVYDAALEVAPWIKNKVQFRECELDDISGELDEETGLIGVHACGVRTDEILSLARKHKLAVAVMPCCHALVKYGERPRAFDETIGQELAVDIDRTYRLRSDGFDVRWTVIPRAITPMNRVIIAIPQLSDGVVS